MANCGSLIADLRLQKAAFVSSLFSHLNRDAVDQARADRPQDDGAHLNP